jgi:hypothetical protein
LSSAMLLLSPLRDRLYPSAASSKSSPADGSRAKSTSLTASGEG